MKKIKKDYEKAHETYQNFSKEEKEKKWHYGRKRYKNLSEDGKSKLVGYRKNIIKREKTLCYNYKKVLFLKNNDLKSYFDEQYKDILKNQFWCYNFTSES